MPQDTATTAVVPDCEVMASVDHSGDVERLIIAELCRENAWISMSTAATVAVGEWR